MEKYNTRHNILELSLKVEHLCSTMLSRILGIISYEDSISFGRSSNALSLNAKINLLLDLKTLDKRDQKLLKTFMFIRNQLMHNLMVDDLKKVFNNNKSELNAFEKLLGKEVIQYENLVADKPLVEDLKKEIDSLNDKIFKSLADTIRKESMIEFGEKMLHNPLGRMLHRDELITNSMTKLFSMTEVFTIISFKGLKVNDCNSELTFKDNKEVATCSKELDSLLINYIQIGKKKIQTEKLSPWHNSTFMFEDAKKNLYHITSSKTVIVYKPRLES